MTSQTKSTFLTESLSQEFENQEDCDVLFSVDGKTIGAHKFMFKIMKARCMDLYDKVMQWKTGDDPILMDNMDYDSFKILLRYVYTDEITFSKENVLVFLSAAVEWKMHHLEELCVEYIYKFMRNENVCFYMNEAVNFKSTVLQEKCREMFSEQAHKITDEAAFRKLTQPALSAFLDVETTDMLEIALFQDIYRWMRQQCHDQNLTFNGTNMRRVIGDALYKIRFPTMTVQDFANSVTTIKGLLTDTEMAQVFQKITVFCSEGIECPFPTKFRCQHNHFRTPFDEADELCKQKLFTLKDSSQLCNLKLTFGKTQGNIRVNRRAKTIPSLVFITILYSLLSYHSNISTQSQNTALCSENDS